MRSLSLLVAAPMLVLPSCYQFEITAQAGYGQFTLDGDIGYQSGTGQVAVAQDVESAFGLGDDEGVPYGRVMIDTGVPVIAVSGFLFDEEGRGVLDANFGDIAANVAVDTEFELANAKVSYAFQIDLGPVAIAPGIAVDYFDLNFQVQDVFATQRETVDLSGPVPLAFLRAEVDLGIVAAVAEGGYMEVDIDDVEASMLDIEALVEVRPTRLLNLFVGYRHLNIQADGEIDGDTFDGDFTLSGFFVGGGLRF